MSFYASRATSNSPYSQARELRATSHFSVIVYAQTYAHAEGLPFVLANVPCRKDLKASIGGREELAICNLPVPLETAKNDEYGHAIHEPYYLSTVRLKPRRPRDSISPPGRDGAACEAPEFSPKERANPCHPSALQGILRPWLDYL